MYSITDREDLNKLVLLQNQVNEVRLQDKLGKEFSRGYEKNI